MTLSTRSCADSRRMPVGSPLASRSMAPPCGGCGFAVYAGGREGGGVGDGDVAVDAVEECGMVAGDFVEVLAGGQAPFAARACDPSCRR